MIKDFDTCKNCGHPVSLLRDRNLWVHAVGSWTLIMADCSSDKLVV